MRKAIYIATIICSLFACEKYDDNSISAKEYRELADKIDFTCEFMPINWYVKGKLNQAEFCMNHRVDNYAINLKGWSQSVTSKPNFSSSDTSSLQGTFLRIRSSLSVVDKNITTTIEYFDIDFPIYSSEKSFQEMLLKEVVNGKKPLIENSLNSQNVKNQYKLKMAQQVMRDNGRMGHSHISTETGSQEDSYLIFQNIKRTTSGQKETLYMEAIFEVNLYKNNGDFWGRLTDGELKLEISYDLVN